MIDPKTITYYIEKGIVSKLSSFEIQNLAGGLYELLFISAEKIPESLGDVHNTNDHGVKRVSFGNGESTFRMLDASFKGVKYQFAIHVYARHNGCCLAVAMPKKDNVFHNVIQFVLDKYVSREEANFWVYHDGTIGGKSLKRSITLDFLKEQDMDLTQLKKIKVVNLGNLPLSDKFSWNNELVKDFFNRLLIYCVYRQILKMQIGYKNGGN